jgi:hypothetical protein
MRRSWRHEARSPQTSRSSCALAGASKGPVAPKPLGAGTSSSEPRPAPDRGITFKEDMKP